ncbi:MAG: U32 family peptidase [archaeon]
MKKISSLTIPCHWDPQVLKQILGQRGNQGIELREVYGVIPRAPIGHGRNPSMLKPLEETEIHKFIGLLKENKINFAYLLNSPFAKEKIKENYSGIRNYIEWILAEIKPDSLVISSREVMDLVREFSDIPITVSTIARVRNAGDLEGYLEINPSKVVVQHDVNREFEELEELVEFAGEQGVKVEVMLTESCIRGCSLMVNHYRTVGGGNSDKLFHQWCNTKKISLPEELLLSNFIRPEDISLYEEMGISHFKITGRSKKPSWLPEVVDAYRNRKFEGNLIRLLGIDPCLNAEDWIHIPNSSLDGFLKNFPRDSNPETEREYCKRWIIKLYQGGNFWVEGVEYKISADNIVPKNQIRELLQIKNAYLN